MAELLIAPPEQSPADEAVDLCKDMIEEGIADTIAIEGGGVAKNPSYLGNEYDHGYAQGRKDAARAVLVVLTGREHVTSDDVKRGAAGT